MRRFGKIVGQGLFLLSVLLAAIWFLTPPERMDRAVTFDPASLPENLDDYLDISERRFDDIVPGVEKRIVWAGEKGAKTRLAVVYIHGFSATSEEIRPVPDLVAEALGANLFFTRLTGHGRGGAAMAEAEAGDWLEDIAEAIAIGRRLGDRVIVMGTSTGATLAVLAASEPALAEGMAGLVLISPNFALQSTAASILDMPLARWWGPMVAGPSRSFAPLNENHAKYWTTAYPTIALFPMAALMREARDVDYAAIPIPALLVYSPEDQVIDPTALGPVIGGWGGPVEIAERHMTPGDDPFSHVIAGDILSPGQTADVARLITAWAGKL